MPQNDILEQISTKVAHIENLLTGGDEPEKGLLMKVDRLAQRYELWARFAWILLGGIPTAVAAIVTYMLKR